MAGIINLSINQGWDIWVTTLMAYPLRYELILAQTYHDFPFVNELFRKDRIEEQSGVAVAWQIVAKQPTASTFTTSYAPTTRTVTDLTVTASIPWTMQTNNYSITIEEIQMNQEPSRLIDESKKRAAAMMVKFCEDTETAAWGTLANSSDVTHPYGMKYLFPAITGAQVTAIAAGTSTQGFLGQNPVYTDANSASTWCGVDRTATPYALTKSFCGPWSNSAGDWNDADVDNMSDAFMQLRFRTPRNAKGLPAEQESGFVVWANRTSCVRAAAKARRNNQIVDRVGGGTADLARFNGETYINGFPIRYVGGYNDTDTSNPIFLLNHNYIKPVVRKGDFFRETTPPPSQELHRVISTYVDLAVNYMVSDPRRAGGIMSYVAAA